MYTWNLFPIFLILLRCNIYAFLIIGSYAHMSQNTTSHDSTHPRNNPFFRKSNQRWHPTHQHINGCFRVAAPTSTLALGSYPPSRDDKVARQRQPTPAETKHNRRGWWRGSSMMPPMRGETSLECCHHRHRSRSVHWFYPELVKPKIVSASSPM
jgi:hypothetical protein